MKKDKKTRVNKTVDQEGKRIPKTKPYKRVSVRDAVEDSLRDNFGSKTKKF